jgi:hypothetical protein
VAVKSRLTPTVGVDVLGEMATKSGGAVTVTEVEAVPVTDPPVTVTFEVMVPASGYAQG